MESNFAQPVNGAFERGCPYYQASEIGCHGAPRRPMFRLSERFSESVAYHSTRHLYLLIANHHTVFQNMWAILWEGAHISIDQTLGLALAHVFAGI